MHTIDQILWTRLQQVAWPLYMCKVRGAPRTCCRTAAKTTSSEACDEARGTDQYEDDDDDLARLGILEPVRDVNALHGLAHS
jgi:hypothetical protein